jgi:hypothetical protein
MVRDPDSAGVRRMNPAAVNPDVAVPVPAVITVVPDPTGMRRTVVTFNDRSRRVDANVDLRQGNSREQSDGEQRRENLFLHG